MTEPIWVPIGGAQGPKGNQGEQGEQGIQGIQGVPGAAGPTHEYIAVRHSANVSLANGTWTAISMDTTIVNSGCSKPDIYRIAAAVAGFYLVVGHAVLTPAQNGYLILELQSDTLGLLASQTGPYNVNAATENRLTVTRLVYLAAGANVYLRAYQNSGGGGWIYGGRSDAPVLSMCRLAA